MSCRVSLLSYIFLYFEMSAAENVRKMLLENNLEFTQAQYTNGNLI